jgi:hypothetical protein
MRRVSDLVLSGIDPFDVSGVDPYGVGAAQTMTAARLMNPGLQRVAAPAIQNAANNAVLAQSMPAVILPVDSGALIGAGVTLGMNIVPVSNVRITRFSVSPAIAGSFIVNSILAGRVNLFAGAGSVPADLFAPNSAGPPIEVPMIQAGTIIQVNVTNFSGAAARFIGAFSTVDLTLKLQGQ